MRQEDETIQPQWRRRQELEGRQVFRETVQLQASGSDPGTFTLTSHLTLPLLSVSLQAPPSPGVRQPISSRFTRGRALLPGRESSTSFVHARC